MSFKSLLSREEMIQLLGDTKEQSNFRATRKMRPRNESELGEGRKNGPEKQTGFPVVQECTFLWRENFFTQALVRI